MDDTERDGSLTLIGLDGEMSSAELDEGGRLIQAGAAAWADEPGGGVVTFSSLIRHPDMAWSQRAAQVHGITQHQLSKAPPTDEVDDMLYTWLLDRGATEGRRSVVPTGFNVVAFDLPFFRHALPRTTSLISRRGIDLNALCYTYADWDPNPAARSSRDFAGWKRSMKTAANAILERSGLRVHEHDAGFDAAQALVGWWWLREQLTAPIARLADLDARLNELDPLRAVLGDGLLDRLSALDRVVIAGIVEALPPDVQPRRWFGTKSPGLGGVTPLQALLDWRINEVLQAASHRT